MSFEDWKDKISNFRTIDVRGTVGNFFPGLKKQAEGIAPLYHKAEPAQSSV